MLRHIVLMKFRFEAEADYLAALDAGVGEMLAIPEVLGSSGGPDVSSKQENHDYAIVLDFADHDAYERYRVHPIHQHFIDRLMKGRTIDKVRLQLNLPD